MQLLLESSEAWKAKVIEDFPRFMNDHADCERKAASTALSLVSRFPDHPDIVEALISLSREEMDHFRKVYRLIKSKGFDYLPNQKDTYISSLGKQIRQPQQQHILDRLLVLAIIEKRAHERLASIAPHIQDEQLQKFYEKLAEEEKAHCMIFLRMAKKNRCSEEVESRLQRLIEIESEILEGLPIRAAIH